MAKKKKRQNIKGPGKCIFCGGGAVPGNPMTREHLWSDWMSEIDTLPKGGEYVEHAQSSDMRTKIPRSQFSRTRQGSAITKKIRVVCERCNTGWMSVLETKVQPILEPLIRGQASILSLESMRTLTEWIMMKTFVVEQNSYLGHPADPIYDQNTRTAFFENKQMPDGVQIFIGLHLGGNWISRFHRYAGGLGVTTVLPFKKYEAARTKTIQSFTWGMGKLIIYLKAFIDPDIRSQVVFGRTHPLHEIWPGTNTAVLWPPHYFVTDIWINDLANALDTFMNSNAVVIINDEGFPV